MKTSTIPSNQVPDPDPRPRFSIASDEDMVVVEGLRCTACGYKTTAILVRCPVCGSDVQPAHFASTGTVFASTVMRIAIPPRKPPFGLAYVVLDDGPRVLAHAGTDHAIAVNARVRLVPSPNPDESEDLYVIEEPA